MKKGIQIVVFLCFSYLSAQENTVQSVYFEFDKFNLNKNEIYQISKIINSPDFSKFEAIQFYGYCDDRGTSDYNDKLSKKRVAVVEQFLLTNGVFPNKIFISEGRGKIILEKDTVKNLKEVRDKNRRVDIIFIKKTTYTSFPEHPKAGDIIILERLRFDMGSSELSLNAKNELNRIVLLLKKHKGLSFEIKGRANARTIINTFR
jgi:outer membrane protein OmpA-like peptidoglycan-associated protein